MRSTSEQSPRYRELLRNRNSVLEGNDSIRLEVICKHVAGKWNVARELRFYSLHDDRHSEKVEEALYEFFPEPQLMMLDARERFLLLASAWLHDIGMIPDLFGYANSQLTDT